jgi:putative hydrolase of the HAD superfamily
VPAITPEIRAVFFDAVGTLLFPNPAAPVVYAGVARRAGITLDPSTVCERFVEAYRTQELIDKAAVWITSEERERDRWRIIVATTLRGVADPEACYRELFEHFAKPDAWRVAPDVAQLLGTLLERGVRIGLGSNYDARLWSVLDGFPELAPLRECVVVSAAVGYRKPSHEFFREVVRVASCQVGQILFVGDDIENDYTGATAAGLKAILLDSGNRHPGLVNRIKELKELTGS